MVNPLLDRRAVLAGLAGSVALPSAAFAKSYVELDWADLLPEGTIPTQTDILGLEDHSALPTSPRQPPSSGVRNDWNGQVVRIPGFIVPIDTRAAGVVAFILVPYVGACVHVPPPPANQLVFVTTDTPFESKGMFEAVQVTGTLGTSTISTELAQIGYALSAERIEPYS